jgi:Putative peptidoglycan binding domain
LQRTKTGWVVRVPPGTRAGTVAVTVSDHAGRHSNAKNVTVLAPPPIKHVPAPTAQQGTLPAVFAGNGMWIWQLSKSDGGLLPTIIAKAHQYGISTVYIKSADGTDTDDWTQFNPGLVQTLHANGIHVCGWQYVYGSNPSGEASAAAVAAQDGADCFVIDAEKEYEGRYAAAQTYMTDLRNAVGPSFPIGLTSFPYVDFHPQLPYSVFLGPGGAQANLPQVYWKDIGDSVDAASAHTYAHNRIYGVPIAALGQTYGGVSASDVQRFRAIWAGYGMPSLSWWDWQETPATLWPSISNSVAPVVNPDPGWPSLAKGNKSDEVVWLQEHLASSYPTVKVTGTFDSATQSAVEQLQTAKGIPVSGETDAATWQAALSLPLTPVDWTS